MAETKQATHGGAILVFCDGKVLYLHPMNWLPHKFGAGVVKDERLLPKGHIEPNESAFIAAKRELIEEAGIVLSPVAQNQHVGVTEFDYKGEHCVVMWYAFYDPQAYQLPTHERLWDVCEPFSISWPDQRQVAILAANWADSQLVYKTK